MGWIINEKWDLTLGAWDIWLQASHRAPLTRELRLTHIRRLARETEAAGPWELSTTDLLAWLAGHTWAAKTRSNYRNSLISFYHWGHVHGHIDHDPAALLPKIKTMPGVPRPAPEEAIHAALSQAGYRERIMLLLGSEAGLRRAEIAQVHTDDLERGIGGWWLRVIGKGDKTRMVPLSDTLADMLRLVPHGWVFPSRKCPGQHLSPQVVGKLLSELLGDGYTGHMLRHRAGTKVFGGSKNIEATRQFLGHASLETTQLYVQVSLDSVRDAATYAQANGPPIESGPTRTRASPLPTETSVDPTHANEWTTNAAKQR